MPASDCPNPALSVLSPPAASSVTAEVNAGQSESASNTLHPPVQQAQPMSPTSKGSTKSPTSGTPDEEEVRCTAADTSEGARAVRHASHESLLSYPTQNFPESHSTSALSCLPTPLPNTPMALPDVVYVGGASVGAPGDTRVRIVHISDTHTLHAPGQLTVPEGDILIHSGDFGKQSAKTFFKFGNWERQWRGFLDFMAAQPHKYKFFVPGNHEGHLMYRSAEWIQQQFDEAKTGMTYLRDHGVEVCGIRIYGTPWNETFAAFGVDAGTRDNIYSRIPEETDILITHCPPQGVLDLTHKLMKNRQHAGACPVCKGHHRGLQHRGCERLMQHVRRSGAGIHLFGHVHGCNGAQLIDGVWFVNSAMETQGTAHIIDVNSARPFEVDVKPWLAKANVPAPKAMKILLSMGKQLVSRLGEVRAKLCEVSNERDDHEKLSRKNSIQREKRDSEALLRSTAEDRAIGREHGARDGGDQAGLVSVPAAFGEEWGSPTSGVRNETEPREEDFDSE